MPQACSICSTEKSQLVNAMLQAGRTPHFIEGELRKMGQVSKAETIRKHRERCLNGDVSNAALLIDAGKGISNTDFAEAVRKVAAAELAAGKLRVRTEHGLQAQALIDRRAEKQADRRLIVEMGLLLSGQRSNPAEIVVGEWKEVGNEADNADADGLAPLALVVEG